MEPRGHCKTRGSGGTGHETPADGLTRKSCPGRTRGKKNPGAGSHVRGKGGARNETLKIEHISEADAELVEVGKIILIKGREALLILTSLGLGLKEPAEGKDKDNKQWSIELQRLGRKPEGNINQEGSVVSGVPPLKKGQRE